MRCCGWSGVARERLHLAENLSKTVSKQAQSRHANMVVKAVRDVDSTQELTVSRRKMSASVEERVVHGAELFGRHGLRGGFEQLVADVGQGGWNRRPSARAASR